MEDDALEREVVTMSHHRPEGGILPVAVTQGGRANNVWRRDTAAAEPSAGRPPQGRNPPSKRARSNPECTKCGSRSHWTLNCDASRHTISAYKRYKDTLEANFVEEDMRTDKNVKVAEPATDLDTPDFDVLL